MWQLIFEQVYTSCMPSFLILLCACVCVCVCVCVCGMSTPKAINSGMICTPYDWLNKLYNLYMQTLVSIVGMALEMKCIIETSLIRVNYIHYIVLYKPLL